MTLTVDITARLKATQRGSNDFQNPAFTPTMEAVLALTDGVAANNADILWIDERSVASGANDDIDLAGALTDAYGTTVASAEVVALFVINAPISGAANTTDLTIGGATNAFVGFLGGTTPTVGPLKPGAFALLAAGDAAGLGAVAAGSTDELRIANSAGAAATYQIAVVARTA